MNIYKLKYMDKETALADFIAKGIYVQVDSELVYSQEIQAVVEIGLIEEVEGYHYDVMSIQDINFGANQIQVNNPIHNFWI